MAKKESSQQASEQQEGKVDRINNALQKFPTCSSQEWSK